MASTQDKSRMWHTIRSARNAKTAIVLNSHVLLSSLPLSSRTPEESCSREAGRQQ